MKLAYLFTILQSFGHGIWMGNILSLYIVLFSEQAKGIFGLTSNELLGITSGISGIAMIMVVFPAGILTDRYPRDLILRLATLLGLIALGFLAVSQSIYLIMFSLFLWGAFEGLSRPAFESIVADSLPTGNRSRTYSRLHLAQQAAMASGPFLNVFLFLFLGDKWDILILHKVLLIGIAFSMISTFLLLFFRDRHTMGEESESVAFGPDLPQAVSRRYRRIPYLLIASNVIIGMGAGMTVKFFPVFFRSIYQLQPISVQLIMGVTLFLTGLSGILAQQLSRHRGRVQMIFFFQLSAIICLVGISFYPALLLLIPLFILRGSLMNASYPLSRSILMDTVPKRQRGKWNALDTFAWGLFWNASAAIGGFLIGENNFQRCFLITAGIYLIGTIPVIMLLPLVEKEIN